MSAPRVACVGAFIVDTLGRPVRGMPVGQRSQILDQIRLAPAGAAGGTAIDLARLGVEVLAVGAVGEDNLAGFLREALAAEGISTDHLVAKPGVQTSASILAVGADGSRPAWHVPGANGELGPEDVPWDEVLACRAVHIGGISALARFDGAPTAELAHRAHAAGLLVTADFLGIKQPDVLERLAPALPDIDLIFPNEEELELLTDEADPAAGACALRRLGANAVVVTRGGEGALIFGPDGEVAVPAIAGPVVDSTGCGDALSAGTIVGLLRGWELPRAVALGTAAAALTLAGLGSDAGVRDWDGTLAVLEVGTAW